MKKVGVAVAVAVLVGCMSSSVFAQPYPRGAELSSNGKVDQAQMQRHAAAAQQEQQRNHKQAIVQQMLRKQPINLFYELATITNAGSQFTSLPPSYGHTSVYPNGSFKGRVLVDTAQKQNYVLISADVWKVIDEMSTMHTLSNTYIVYQTITTADGHEYKQAGNAKLNAQDWKVGEKHYTLLSFPFADNKSDKK